jgi:hypothetical protein
MLSNIRLLKRVDKFINVRYHIHITSRRSVYSRETGMDSVPLRGRGIYTFGIEPEAPQGPILR